MKLFKGVFTLILAYIICLSCCGLSAFAAEFRDLKNDTWVATDDLGRVTPLNDETGDIKQEKYVGIFYFMFLGDKGSDILDISFSYKRGGIEAVWEDMVHGDGTFFWAKPYLGYYRNDDAWVFAKHAQLLSDAGVDFVYLDVTNYGAFFESSWQKLLDVWSEIRANGGVTPQVVFHCGDKAETGKLHTGWLWDKLYKKGLHKDLWFYWEGKPLVLGNTSTLSDEIKNEFTVRRSWAFNSWTSESDGAGRWPWVAEYPQEPGKDYAGNIEQIAVSAGFHANSSKGRSFHSGANEVTNRYDFGFGLETSGLGLAFQEQWNRVFEVDPKIVMLTGWNEFTAGRWIDKNATTQLVAGTYKVTEGDPQFKYVYVDLFSPEYSRDIEPISEFFRDNYYYQMVSNIRRFKGTRTASKNTGDTDININGDLSELNNVGPEFLDSTYDIQHRKAKSVGGVYTYTNETGRNDFELAKVSKYGDFTYFYVKCVSDIVEDSGTNWMNLYIDSDQYYYTGWSGYDYVINRSHGDGKVSVEKFVDNKWNFETVGEAEYSIKGKELIIKVKSSLVSLDKRDNFDFKWADNSTITGEVMEFMDLGDSAPNARFNYRYVKEGGVISNEILPGARTPDLYGAVGYKDADAFTDVDLFTLIIIITAIAVLVVLCVVLIVVKKKASKAGNTENSKNT